MRFMNSDLQAKTASYRATVERCCESRYERRASFDTARSRIRHSRIDRDHL